MAILVQSNKKPSVTFPEQTGSIVTFNLQYAGLPLKSCKVNIPVTQEGTGDPSPTNVRNFVGISSLDFTANSDVKTFTFGQTIYAGELDFLTGIFTATHKLVDLSSLSWNYQSENGRFASGDIYNSVLIPPDVATPVNGACSHLKVVKYESWSTNNSICVSNSGMLYIRSTDYTTVEDLLTALNDAKLVYPLAEPEVINLGGMEIETLQGENNLFASTGETTASYIKIGG